MSPKRAARTLAAAGATALLLAAAPAAMANTATVTGKINPNHGRPGTPLRLSFGFRLAPADGMLPGTLRQVVVQLPPNATANGALFPFCSADTINAARGSGARCPKGSKIGTGKVMADVWAVDTFNVPATIEFFNGKGGKSITLLVHATNPVQIDLAFDAPLVRTSGRYGYRLTAPLPEKLMDVNPPSHWFAAEHSLVSSIGSTMMIRGRKRGYIEAKRCPKSGKVPIAGSFSFLDVSSIEPRQANTDASGATATGTITCKP